MMADSSDIDIIPRAEEKVQIEKRKVDRVTFTRA
jgi:hypothetical protein